MKTMTFKIYIFLSADSLSLPATLFVSVKSDDPKKKKKTRKTKAKNPLKIDFLGILRFISSTKRFLEIY